MSNWDVLIFLAAGYLAVIILVRMMQRRRDEVLEELRRQVALEQMRKRKAERLERRRKRAVAQAEHRANQQAALDALKEAATENDPRRPRGERAA